ncbi:MAG: sel1 repeat family protein [Spirochaetes bacterium]|nr:sel1 repeat family protein [Spirochaetota bacterium]
MNIDEILEAPENAETAEELEYWISSTNNKILRGDLMIGIMDIDEAYKIPAAYEKLIRCGKNEAFEGLAEWYAYPPVGEADCQKADECYMKMMELGIPGADFTLAQFRWFKRRYELSDSEKAESLALLDEDIKNGLTEAMVLKGYMIADGFGGYPDIPEAVEIFKKAAEMGNTDAMFELYVYYSTGNGIPEDPEAAFRYNAEAAEKGHDRAMMNMGSFFATGRYVEKDINEAVEWYKKAAGKGNERAAYILGVMYCSGDEIEKNTELGLEYFEIAEMNGYDYDAVQEMLELYREQD